MQWFAPPDFPEDRDKTRRASLLNGALVTLLALMPVLVVGNLIGGRVPTSVYGGNVAMFVACLMLRAWMCRGAVEQAGALLLVLAMVVVTATLARLGTVRSPTASMYLLVILTAGLVSGRSGMIATIVGCTLAVAGLIVAGNAGKLPPPDLTVGITQGVTFAALFAWTGGLMFAAIQSLRKSVTDAETEVAARTLAEGELARHLGLLEETVRERTADLRSLNERLRSELDVRASVEEQRERLIAELEASLAKVSALSGIIPICMHCKSIRDDKGYWNRVEHFIREHSSAEFTHGICPSCLATHYPEE
jgi:hypothetical protein